MVNHPFIVKLHFAFKTFDQVPALMCTATLLPTQRVRKERHAPAGTSAPLLVQWTPARQRWEAAAAL